MKPTRIRERALDDLDHAVACYDENAAHVVARFTEAFLNARRHIAQHPGMGSLRYADNGRAPGLRFCLLDGFPYAVFYIERADFIEIVRVLHQASDIPAHLEL